MNIKTAVLITEQDIQNKIKELALILNKKFRNKKLIAIGVLKGSFTFYSDLLRALDTRIVCDFCATSSYGHRHSPSKEVQLTLDIATNITGEDVLLIEDIVDRGLTVGFLQSIFQSRNPKSLHTVALIKRTHGVKYSCQIDYTGFQIESSSFLVGYGMDYQEQFRHLPHIAEILSLN